MSYSAGVQLPSGYERGERGWRNAKAGRPTADGCYESKKGSASEGEHESFASLPEEGQENGTETQKRSDSNAHRNPQ